MYSAWSTKAYTGPRVLAFHLRHLVLLCCLPAHLSHRCSAILQPCLLLYNLAEVPQVYKQQQAAVATEGSKETRFFEGAPAIGLEVLLLDVSVCCTTLLASL